MANDSGLQDLMEMWMSPPNEAPYPMTTNEPKVHPLIKGSFAFVPSAGMRLAPEVLVLELMREVFCQQHYGETKGTRDLDPDKKDDEGSLYCTDRERAVLYALRGRRKKAKNSKTLSFFAPAYPQLARLGWLSKNRERVVNNFLLSGPVAQHLWQRGQGTEDGRNRQQELGNKIRHALLGNRSFVAQDIERRDILAAALGSANFDRAIETARQNLRDKTSRESVMMIDGDELADRITQDLIAICDLEPKLPRMQWLQVLMTFLRFALPMWLLAQMQITRLLHTWLLDAIDHEQVAAEATIQKDISRRNRGLLHPTLTPTRELFEHVDQYMKCRVELNIFLYYLEQTRKNQVDGKVLSLDERKRHQMSINQLLTIARDASWAIRDGERFKQIAGDLNIETLLTREGEQCPAWRNPRMKGQGKNIDEFFRVLYRAEFGDENGGYLLVPVGRGQERGFRVFPGQMLLKTVTYLAAQNKWSNQDRRGGMLVLQDVEDHFAQYGIDFSAAADARPLLMGELQAMGLLTGSPDAGSSVAVRCPYIR